MGTRSLTRIIQKWEDKNGNEKRRPICCMYRQYDGYMSGHGQDLADFLKPFTLTNGIGLSVKTADGKLSPIANGMDCLAAQMIAHFKDGAGGIYLQHPDTEDVWEEYIYEIEEGKGGKFIVTVHDTYEKEIIFQGSVRALINKIKKLQEAEKNNLIKY